MDAWHCSGMTLWPFVLRSRTWQANSFAFFLPTSFCCPAPPFPSKDLSLDMVTVAIREKLSPLGEGTVGTRKPVEGGFSRRPYDAALEADVRVTCVWTPFHACWRNMQFSQAEGHFSKRVAEPHSTVRHMSVWVGHCGSGQAEHFTLGMLFAVELSTFKNVTRLCRKQQPNSHVGPREVGSGNGLGGGMGMVCWRQEQSQWERETHLALVTPAAEAIRACCVGLPLWLASANVAHISFSLITLNISKTGKLW